MSRKNRSRKQQDPKPRVAEAAPAADMAPVADPIETSAGTAGTLESGAAVDAFDTDTPAGPPADAAVDLVVDTEAEADAAVAEEVVAEAVVAEEAGAEEAGAEESSAEGALAEGDAAGESGGDEVDDDAAVSAAEGALDIEAVTDAAGAEATGETADEEAVARANAASYDRLKPIIEALIFASPEPLTPKTLFKLLENEPKEDVETALAMLRADYDHPGGLQLVEVAGGYQIVTRPELHEYVRRLFHERTSSKLSVQALETLAVIAYKQPITAPEITEIRGVNTSGVLNTLIDRKLVKIVGRKNVVGRPFMYATTRDFLDKFGLNDLSDLPKVEDLADVLGFEPPSLDANEPTAEALAFDFGDPEEGGAATEAASGATAQGTVAGAAAEGAVSDGAESSRSAESGGGTERAAEQVREAAAEAGGEVEAVVEARAEADAADAHTEVDGAAEAEADVEGEAEAEALAESEAEAVAADDVIEEDSEAGRDSEEPFVNAESPAFAADDAHEEPVIARGDETSSDPEEIP